MIILLMGGGRVARGEVILVRNEVDIEEESQECGFDCVNLGVFIEYFNREGYM